MERKDKEQNKKSTDSWAIKLWKKKKQKSHMPMTSWMTPKTTIYVYFEMWTMIQGQQTPLPLTTWQKKKKKQTYANHLNIQHCFEKNTNWLDIIHTYNATNNKKTN
jgi:hypothetical protein